MTCVICVVTGEECERIRHFLWKSQLIQSMVHYFIAFEKDSR